MTWPAASMPRAAIGFMPNSAHVPGSEGDLTNAARADEFAEVFRGGAYHARCVILTYAAQPEIGFRLMSHR